MSTRTGRRGRGDLGWSLIMMGFFGTLFGGWGAVRQAEVESFKPVEAEVIEARVQVGHTTSKGRTRTHYEPLISYRYQVDGRDYQNDWWTIHSAVPKLGSDSAAQAEVAQFRPGTRIQVFYSPEDPSRSVRMREDSAFYMVLTMGAMAVGALGVGVKVMIA